MLDGVLQTSGVPILNCWLVTTDLKMVGLGCLFAKSLRLCIAARTRHPRHLKASWRRASLKSPSLWALATSTACPLSTASQLICVRGQVKWRLRTLPVGGLTKNLRYDLWYRRYDLRYASGEKRSRNSPHGKVSGAVKGKIELLQHDVRHTYKSLP